MWVKINIRNFVEGIKSIMFMLPYIQKNKNKNKNKNLMKKIEGNTETEHWTLWVALTTTHQKRKKRVKK